LILQKNICKKEKPGTGDRLSFDSEPLTGFLSIHHSNSSFGCIIQIHHSDSSFRIVLHFSSSSPLREIPDDPDSF